MAYIPVRDKNFGCQCAYSPLFLNQQFPRSHPSPGVGNKSQSPRDLGFIYKKSGIWDPGIPDCRPLPLTYEKLP